MQLTEGRATSCVSIAQLAEVYRHNCRALSLTEGRGIRRVLTAQPTLSRIPQ